jgi:hypothetical protein
MPACRAASSRDNPSWIIATASNRRVCAASRHFAARARSSDAVCSMRVTATPRLTRPSITANRRHGEANQIFAVVGIAGESDITAVGISEVRGLEQVGAQDRVHDVGFRCWGPSHASPFGTRIGFRRRQVGESGLRLSAWSRPRPSAMGAARACRTGSGQPIRSASAALTSALACSAPRTLIEAIAARASSGVTSLAMLTRPNTLMCSASPLSRAASRSVRL